MARAPKRKNAQRSSKKVTTAKKAVKKIAKKVAAKVKKAPAKKAATRSSFKERTIRAGGFTIRVAEAGKGDAVIAIHGGGGMRISAAHELLAKKYRVVAFEIPGFGKSPTNDKSASLQALAQTMNEAIAALGIKKYSIMGVSFGAKLGAWMAVEAPDRLKTLVMISPATIRLERDIPVARTPEERMALFHAHPESQPAPAKVDPKIDQKQTALIRRLIGPARDAELETRLKELNVPSLAVFGTHDRITPPEAARLYRDVFPDCYLVMVYDAAHAIDADRPEAVAEVVSDFIDRQDKFLVTGESGVIHP
jgi:pimeloyl-ACP methyl ester carboxylesterase